MNYNIAINDFEGPMDLLLHLVKEQNIDIIDLNIEEVTEQYLNYIKEAEELSLDIASEYLTLAAELIEIKSNYLLPNKNEVIDEYEEDPRKNLINRLLEYKKYKEVISEFKILEEERKKYFSKSPSSLNEFKDNTNIDYGDLNLDVLIKAFQNFIERKEDEKPLNTKITKKEYSVSVRSIEIKKILKDKKKVNFDELFEIKSKEYIVVTFLSILSMTKNGEILISQNDNFGNIEVSLKDSE